LSRTGWRAPFATPITIFSAQARAGHFPRCDRVLAAVRDLGLDSSTLVIFTTDHGIAMPRAKRSVYDPILNGAVTGPLHQRSQAWLQGES
jgi:hypothetical protein